MTLTPLAWLRRARLRALLARQLENWDAVWIAYERGSALPVLRFRDGRTFHHGPRDAPVFLFLEIFANRCYSRLTPSAVTGPIIDIGANIGAFTLECAARHPASLIHAYEPDAVSRDVLRHNVAVNGLDARVTIWPEAVAASDGEIDFRQSEASLESGSLAAAGCSVRVASVSLDTVLTRAGGAAGLLKIDAEGAEVEILEMASGITRAGHIVGEFHPWLVENARNRLQAALSADFDVEFIVNRRCGAMFAASVRARPR